MNRFVRSIFILMALFPLVACSSLTGLQERYVVCPYDHVWDAALESVKDRSVVVKDKDKGVIQTAWLEIPMEGRTFGAFQREMKDSKDRSRIKMDVKRLNDVMRVSFIEERERWAFRGGSRLFGWVPTDTSEDVVSQVAARLNNKLLEHGCTAT